MRVRQSFAPLLVAVLFVWGFVPPLVGDASAADTSEVIAVPSVQDLELAADPTTLPLVAMTGAARAAGAFGVYKDTGGAVVVAMPLGASGFSVGDAAAFGVAATIKTLNVSADTVRELKSRARDFRSVLDTKYSYAAYFDIRLGKFVIETSAPGDAFAPVVAGFEDVVDLRSDGQFELTGDRMADTAPFKGGAAVNGLSDDGGYNWCTSGYPVVLTGTTRGMVTAGHCFRSSATVKASKYANSGNEVGTVTRRDYPSYEAEIVSGKTYTSYLYTGANSSATEEILGRFYGWIGQQYICVSGTSGGFACDWVFADDDILFCSSLTNCTDHVYAYHGNHESIPGDSGGPIWLYYTTSGVTGALIHSVNFGKGCFVIIGCTFYGMPWTRTLSRFSLTQACYFTSCKVPF